MSADIFLTGGQVTNASLSGTAHRSGENIWTVDMSSKHPNLRVRGIFRGSTFEGDYSYKSSWCKTVETGGRNQRVNLSGTWAYRTHNSGHVKFFYTGLQLRSRNQQKGTRRNRQPNARRFVESPEVGLAGARDRNCMRHVIGVYTPQVGERRCACFSRRYLRRARKPLRRWHRPLCWVRMGRESSRCRVRREIPVVYRRLRRIPIARS